MENVLQQLVLLAPGFFGVAGAKLATGKLDNENLNGGVFKYFIYTSTAWLFTLAVDVLGERYSFTIEESTHTIIPLAFACVLGFLWPICLCDIALSIANAIRRFFGKIPIFPDGTIFEKLSCENRPHYYEVYRNNTLVASGWAEYLCYTENSFSLIKVDGYDIADMKEVRNVLWVGSDMVIKEYSPEEPAEYEPEPKPEKRPRIPPVQKPKPPKTYIPKPK